MFHRIVVAIGDGSCTDQLEAAAISFASGTDAELGVADYLEARSQMVERLVELTGINPHALLLLVGLYLVAYWRSVLTGYLGSPVLDLGGRARAAAQNWFMGETGRWFVFAAVALILAAFLAGAFRGWYQARGKDETTLAGDPPGSGS